MSGFTVTLEARFATAVEPSRRVCEVAAMFGLGVDQRKEVQVLPPTTLRLAPGRLLFVTGASGGGKTTLLRKLAESVRGERGISLIDFQELGTRNAELGTGEGEKPLVESLPGSLEQTIRWLSLAGLNDAFVMLRKPSELSDGQRYRFRLAQAMAMGELGTRNAELGTGEGEGMAVRGSVSSVPRSAFRVCPWSWPTNSARRSTASPPR